MWKKLKYLRSAPEDVKQKWLLGTSALAMIMIVSLWLAYFNTLLEPLGGTASPPRTQNAAQEDSTWDTMALGVRLTLAKFKDGLLFLESAFRAPRDYIINP